MASPNVFLAKRVKNLEEFFVPFSPLTRLPYVECDCVTFDDQIYLFDTEEGAKAFVKQKLEQEKIPLQGVKLQKAQSAGFWMNLYGQGINALMIGEGNAEPVRLNLEEIHEKPDIAQLNAGRIPLMNPELTLTAAYFLQEQRRNNPYTATSEQVQRMQELEEEMTADLARSRFIVAVQLMKGPQQGKDPKNAANNVQIPCMKAPDGSIYQPLFSDIGEFRRAYPPNAQMQMTAISFSELIKYLNPAAKGFVLNPSTLQLTLTREKIQDILA